MRISTRIYTVFHAYVANLISQANIIITPLYAIEIISSSKSSGIIIH